MMFGCSPMEKIRNLEQSALDAFAYNSAKSSLSGYMRNDSVD